MPEETNELLSITPPAETPPPAETLLKPPAGREDGQKPPDPWDGDGWIALVPEKFRDDKGELRVKDVARSYLELEKRFGAGEAPPKTSDDYKLTYKLPAGVEMNREMEKAILSEFHAAGMNGRQAQLAMDRYVATLSAQLKARDADVKTAEAELRKSWGADYDNQLSLAVKAYDRLVDAGDTETINRVGNDPAVLRLLAKVGAGLKEDTPPAGASPMAEEDVQALMKSPAYWNASDPEHERIKAKITAHFNARHPKRTA